MIISDLQPKFVKLILEKAIAKTNSSGACRVKFLNNKTSDIQVEITKKGSIRNYYLTRLVNGEDRANYECGYFKYTVGRAIINSDKPMISDHYLEESISHEIKLEDDKDMYFVRPYNNHFYNLGGKAIAVATLENAIGFLISHYK